ncbi:MAG: hypothetical protein GX647_02980 [Clostridiales bacterium]|jgi:Na+-translocating ferredoxin:NAD+ oxidoreductase RnfE subunit|nr:hypothetical protein [Clostridiales bacterium]OPZ69375.1 MAG: hypothetical protein BWY81_00457 [Firmicutes bacterium ADurb.Bin467]
MDERLVERLEKIAGSLERMRLEEYMRYVCDRKRLIIDSLLQGILRGFGITLGVAMLGALVAIIIRNIVVENIPLIGGFLAEVVHAIQAKM